MKVAIAASEVVPFAKTGGLADVAGALPLALEHEGQEVIVVMPGYKEIKNKKLKTQRLKDDISYSVIGKNVKVYFIENDKYFGRDGLYTEKGHDYSDNLDRFSYYCQRALALLKEIDFKPDIIHIHDWQASLIPVFLKNKYNGDSFYKDTRTLLTIHNIGYQGLFPKEEFVKLGLDQRLFSMEGMEFYGKTNLLKGGMIFSDLINTVSPTYSREIQTQEFGFGLEGVLKKREGSLFGILNGLDYSLWNPEKDSFISERYSAGKPQGKAKDKADLQKLCGLAVKKDVPLLGIVSRLAGQKGFDILAGALDEIFKLDVEIVILGTGEPKYHKILEDAAKKHSSSFALYLKFDNVLAHKIYAGSDLFLMPSKYEPCGLGQMISLKYGTIPLVFKTGGLADTVNSGNGFVFDQYSSSALLEAIKKAVEAFKNKRAWKALVEKAFTYDFSWEESARHYIKLYEKAKAA